VFAGKDIRQAITYFGRFFAILGLLVVWPAIAQARGMDIEVRFGWTDSFGCCVTANLRFFIDGAKVSASSVMLGEYADLDTHRSRSIEVSPKGDWNCADHTQGRTDPDPRNWGVNYEVCVKLVSGASADPRIFDYVLRIKNPEVKYTSIIDVIFKLEVVRYGSCHASLVSARTRYPNATGAWVAATAPTEQTCYFVAPD
jgi:hypothetical protein